MDCEQARQLFDAYLDGELSSRLATELGAHRVQCPECRQALALMEVTGHIIASDEEPVTLRRGFSERLLACMESPRGHWSRQVRRALYIAVPLAAAAVIVLAFVGVFDGGSAQVAGEKVERMRVEALAPDFEAWAETSAARDPEGDPGELERSVERLRQNLVRKGRSVDLLQNAADMTVRQLLDMLEEAQKETLDADHFPGADSVTPTSGEPAPTDGEDREAP